MTVWEVLLCRFWVHRWDKWSEATRTTTPRQHRHCQRCNKLAYRWVI